MSWNYRVFRCEQAGEVYHQIREAYYENGRLTYYSVDPMHPHGETVAELRSDLILMERALDLPVLTTATAVGSPAPPRSKQGPPGGRSKEPKKPPPKNTAGSHSDPPGTPAEP